MVIFFSRDTRVKRKSVTIINDTDTIADILQPRAQSQPQRIRSAQSKQALN